MIIAQCIAFNNAFCYTIDEDIVVECDYVKIKKVQLEDIVVERDYVKIKKVQLEEKALVKGLLLFLYYFRRLFMKNFKIYFLSQEFYNNFPKTDYPEIAEKQTRPYIQVCLEIDGVKFAVPFRSNINHKNVLWTNKENKCGLDFSKSVVIEKPEYIDTINKPIIRDEEFESLRGKEHLILAKLKQYIEKFKKARDKQTIYENRNF